MTSQAITGELFVPGDKSISHRALIFSAISHHTVTIYSILWSEDVKATLNALVSMGVSCQIINEKTSVPDSKTIIIQGVGLDGLQAPKKTIHCGNSGTTMRLLCGLLSAQSFDSELIGDVSLMTRPMARVVEPLRLMGANVHMSPQGTAPLKIIGNQTLRSIQYPLPVASAQVQTALQLADLYADQHGEFMTPAEVRDHTKRLLPCLMQPGEQPLSLTVPGDLSSAAFFIVAATLIPGSDVIIKHVGINPTRLGVIHILKAMGATIDILNKQGDIEPDADIRVRYASLTGITIPSEYVSLAIDEFPVLFIAAAFAKGKTRLSDASELRVKESDRIHVMAAGLKQLGIEVEEYEDGLTIEGNVTFSQIPNVEIDCANDHRVAMAFHIANRVLNGSLTLKNDQAICTSFPSFIALLKSRDQL